MGLPVPPFAAEIFGPDAILMKGLTGLNWRLKDYEERGGYQALRKIFAQGITPEQVVKAGYIPLPGKVLLDERKKLGFP